MLTAPLTRSLALGAIETPLDDPTVFRSLNAALLVLLLLGLWLTFVPSRRERRARSLEEQAPDQASVMTGSADAPVLPYDDQSRLATGTSDPRMMAAGPAIAAQNRATQNTPDTTANNTDTTMATTTHIETPRTVRIDLDPLVPAKLVPALVSVFETRGIALRRLDPVTLALVRDQNQIGHVSLHKELANSWTVVISVDQTTTVDPLQLAQQALAACGFTANWNLGDEVLLSDAADVRARVAPMQTSQNTSLEN